MAHKGIVVALGLIVAASPVAASQTEPMGPGAPAAGPDARYCLRIEAITGSRLEKVVCKTREQWAYDDVDVDVEWAKEGVTVLGG